MVLEEIMTIVLGSWRLSWSKMCSEVVAKNTAATGAEKNFFCVFLSSTSWKVPSVRFYKIDPPNSGSCVLTCSVLYMYEIDLLWVSRGWGAPIILQQRQPMSKTNRISYCCFTTLREQISGWGCILMTNSHSSRGWNTLYMYEIDMLWVWRGWGVPIILQQRKPMSKTNRISYCRFNTLSEQISGWGCILMTNSHSSRCWNTLYMYEIDLLWVSRGWGVPIILQQRKPMSKLYRQWGLRWNFLKLLGNFTESSLKLSMGIENDETS